MKNLFELLTLIWNSYVSIFLGNLLKAGFTWGIITVLILFLMYFFIFKKYRQFLGYKLPLIASCISIFMILPCFTLAGLVLESKRTLKAILLQEVEQSGWDITLGRHFMLPLVMVHIRKKSPKQLDWENLWQQAQQKPDISFLLNETTWNQSVNDLSLEAVKLSTKTIQTSSPLQEWILIQAVDLLSSEKWAFYKPLFQQLVTRKQSTLSLEQGSQLAGSLFISWYVLDVLALPLDSLYWSFLLGGIASFGGMWLVFYLWKRRHSNEEN